MGTLLGVCGLRASRLSDTAEAHVRAMAQAAAGGDGGIQTFEMTQSAGLALGACGLGSPGAVSSPRVVQASRAWLCFSGRLGHRGDLCRLLGLPNRTRQGEAPLSDAQLLMAAYLRFGIDCVQYLAGDWSFALWDNEQSRLVLARDATGFSELYWATVNGHLHFASSLPVLLAGGVVPRRPCPTWFAGLLSVFSDPARPTSTAFQDVSALPPGHLLVASQQGSSLQRWWRPERDERLYHQPLEQLREEFLAIYQASVRDLVPEGGQGVAATLSGGLDSGSVVALAAPLLAQRGQRLTAYVHVPRFDARTEFPVRMPDEWDMALATATHVGNVDARPCKSEHISPVDGIRQWLQMAVTPSHAAANWYWLLDIARTAADQGAGVLLLGQAGNSTVSFAGDGNLWPRLNRLQWRMTARELRQDIAGPFAAAKDRILKPLLRPAYRALTHAREPRGDSQPWASYSLVHPEHARQTGLLAAMLEAGHDPTFKTQSRARIDQFRLTLLGGNSNGSAVWSALGRACGIEPRDPTRDRRLVEFCRWLPDELFWAHGLRRGLVRQAMSTALPQNVLLCKTKGQQSGDLRLRLHACAPQLLAEGEQLYRHPLVSEWVDVPRFRRAMEALAAHGSSASDNDDLSSALGAQHVLRTLAAAMFISQHG